DGGEDCLSLGWGELHDLVLAVPVAPAFAPPRRDRGQVLQLDRPAEVVRALHEVLRPLAGDEVVGSLRREVLQRLGELGLWPTFADLREIAVRREVRAA